MKLNTFLSKRLKLKSRGNMELVQQVSKYTCIFINFLLIKQDISWKCNSLVFIVCFFVVVWLGFYYDFYISFILFSLGKRKRGPNSSSIVVKEKLTQDWKVTLCFIQTEWSTVHEIWSLSSHCSHTKCVYTPVSIRQNKWYEKSTQQSRF